MREITYSTKLVTMRDMINFARVQKSDYEALADLIEARTDLSRDEILELAGDDLQAVIAGVADGVSRANTLNDLGKSL